MEEQTFEQWIEEFKSNVSGLNYHGPIDEESFRSEYDNEVDPAEAAADFVDEMNEE